MMENIHIKRFCSKIMLMFALGLLMTSCKKDKVDTRSFEAVKIVGVKVNGKLFLPKYSGQSVIVTLPAGKDLSSLNLQLLVANGVLVGFENNSEYDCRKPLKIDVKGSDGSHSEVTLMIQSPPDLASLIIEGLTIQPDDIHFTQGSLIVQVPDGTDLSNLSVTMEFLNGTLTNFKNGEAADYSKPISLTLLGVDEETQYTYDLIITTQEVGPAAVLAMTINGIPTDSVALVGSDTLIPYLQGLTDFSKADVGLETGFGNRVDPSFSGKGLNLLSGDNEVKVTGTDGAEVKFIIARPRLSLDPVLDKSYDQFGFGANDMAGVAFSGDHVVISNYTAVSPTVVGPNYYDLTGNQIGVLDKSGVVVAHSLRKLASDDNGKLLVVSLGITADQQTIYKWDNLTASPVPFITYSKSTLGINGNMRAAGINITGDLDKDAIITVGYAKHSEVFVWKVHNGVVDNTPTKLTVPYNAPSYYYSVEPMPIGTDGYIGAINGNDFSGIALLTNTLDADLQLSGIITSDCKVKKYKGRIYLAYTAYVSGKGAIFRICDITDREASSFRNPIFEKWMVSNQPNGNGTMDADMTVINGKLYALFACTNIGLQVYKLEN